MAGTRQRFRRTSINMRDGLARKYDARVEMIVEEGRVTWRVFSRTMPDRFSELHSSGDVAADELHLESICERMDEFDRNNRVRPVPKPERTTPAPSVVVNACTICGGNGFVTDDEDYPHVCSCRG